MRRSALLGTLFAFMLLVELAPSGPGAGATVPGANGKIAFSSNRDGDYEIYVMDNDGSDPVNLTNNPDFDYLPAWSPDGTKITFSRNSSDGNTDIFVMNADGSGQVNLTNTPHAGDFYPAWSPDGTKIAFSRDTDIYIMDADGSDQVNLTNDPDTGPGGIPVDNYDPAWSPDGTKIAYARNPDVNTDIYVIDADGSDRVNLTNSPGHDYYPAWSPDGTEIAFTADRDGNQEIYVMAADGSNQVNRTNSPTQDYYPAWSPDGTKIAFTTCADDLIGCPGATSEIYVMDADGSNQVNLTNNRASDWLPDWQALPLGGPQADLGLTKQDSADPVVVGQSFTYSLSLVNNGPDGATDVVVTDALPPEVTFQAVRASAGTCSQAAGTVSCNIAALASGGSVRIRIDVTAVSEGTAVNTAEVDATETDQVASNNTATQQTTINAASEQPTLTVSVVGQGRVVSRPQGISCPPDCIEDYAPGTSVLLRARPASGWVFAGWSGDCTGTSSCTVVMDGDKSVTATFQQA